MNLKLNNIHCLIMLFFSQYLLHNGLSSGDPFQLFIVFNYTILTAVTHKEDTLLLFKQVYIIRFSHSACSLRQEKKRTEYISK